MGELGSKVKVRVTQYSFFYSYFSVNFHTVDLNSINSDENEIQYFTYICTFRIVFEFHKNPLADNVIVMSFVVYFNNFPKILFNLQY